MTTKKLIELLEQFEENAPIKITDPAYLIVQTEDGWVDILSFWEGDKI